MPILSCLPYQHAMPSFALPLLGDVNSGSVRFVQEIDETTGCVEQFRILENADHLAPLLELKFPFSAARIGYPPIYVFLDQALQIHIGTLSAIESILRAFLVSNSKHAALKLQISELIGSDQEKRRFRAQIRGLVAKTSGSNAARAFYEGSVLRAALWESYFLRLESRSCETHTESSFQNDGNVKS